MGGRVFDMDGNDVTHTLNGVGASDFSFGAQVWELTHPGQVQREQEITGNPDDVQSRASIMARAAININPYANPWDIAADAYSNMTRSTDATIEAGRAAAQAAGQAVDDALEAAKAAAKAAGNVGQWVVVGVVALVALEVMRSKR